MNTTEDASMIVSIRDLRGIIAKAVRDRFGNTPADIVDAEAVVFDVERMLSLLPCIHERVETLRVLRSRRPSESIEADIRAIEERFRHNHGTCEATDVGQPCSCPPARTR